MLAHVISCPTEQFPDSKHRQRRSRLMHMSSTIPYDSQMYICRSLRVRDNSTGASLYGAHWCIVHPSKLARVCMLEYSGERRKAEEA